MLVGTDHELQTANEHSEVCGSMVSGITGVRFDIGFLGNKSFLIFNLTDFKGLELLKSCYEVVGSLTRSH